MLTPTFKKFTHQTGKDIFIDTRRIMSVLHETQAEGEDGADKLDILQSKHTVHYCVIFLDCREHGIIVKGNLPDVMFTITDDHNIGGKN